MMMKHKDEPVLLKKEQYNERKGGLDNPLSRRNANHISHGDDLVALWNRNQQKAYQDRISRIKLVFNKSKSLVSPLAGVFCERWFRTKFEVIQKDTKKKEVGFHAETKLEEIHEIEPLNRGRSAAGYSPGTMTRTPRFSHRGRQALIRARTNNIEPVALSASCADSRTLFAKLDAATRRRLGLTDELLSVSARRKRLIDLTEFERPRVSNLVLAKRLDDTGRVMDETLPTVETIGDAFTQAVEGASTWRTRRAWDALHRHHGAAMSMAKRSNTWCPMFLPKRSNGRGFFSAHKSWTKSPPLPIPDAYRRYTFILSHVGDATTDAAEHVKIAQVARQVARKAKPSQMLAEGRERVRAVFNGVVDKIPILPRGEKSNLSAADMDARVTELVLRGLSFDPRVSKSDHTVHSDCPADGHWRAHLKVRNVVRDALRNNSYGVRTLPPKFLPSDARTHWRVAQTAAGRGGYYAVDVVEKALKAAEAAFPTIGMFSLLDKHASPLSPPSTEGTSRMAAGSSDRSTITVPVSIRSHTSSNRWVTVSTENARTRRMVNLNAGDPGGDTRRNVALQRSLSRGNWRPTTSWREHRAAQIRMSHAAAASSRQPVG
jgi:hypothetical protein